MTADSRLTVSRTAVILGAVALVGIGAAASYLIVARTTPAGTSAELENTPARATGMSPMGSGSSAGAGSRAASGSSATGENATIPDAVITLSQEAIERAGIAVAPVTTSDAAARLRIPGVVQANAYRQVAVTPLVGGRVTQVTVALGDHVRRGQTLAQIYSPELADTQSQFVSASAELEAAHQERRRTERLVEIGAASRQELENIRAEHTGHATRVESARSKLVLLGMAPGQVSRLSSTSRITAAMNVPAPIDGVVTERVVNAGLNVDPSMTLFTIVDLSTVWVVGDLYEKDFASVREGTLATMTTTAYPGLTLRGRVSYIDPQVNSQTRTAHVRVEVKNLGGQLRLGMYADLQLEQGAGTRAVMLPKSAVQDIGNRQVVYLADAKEPGRFIEREVRLGSGTGDQVEALAGIRPGDVVVTAGSFSLRAERERSGPGRNDAAPPTNTTSTPAAGRVVPTAPEASAGPSVQTARVVVSEQGFEPAKLTLRAGVPARITFTRTTDKTCATEVVFPSLKITRPLPLNEPVTIELTPRSGEIAFTCGMNMLHGAVVAQ